MDSLTTQRMLALDVASSYTAAPDLKLPSTGSKLACSAGGVCVINPVSNLRCRVWCTGDRAGDSPRQKRTLGS